MRNLTVFVHQSGFGCYPDQRTDGVKQIHENQHKNNDQHVNREYLTEIELHEGRRHGVRQGYG
ncbi:hypothetical protein SDC9_204698 [bioreactor metagenome]|uniref:Uncharacterized protein n=1 Tax=bioreactor metagenome TaxID=1076179 RepID=A0A645J947_9ZZZZ